MTKVNKEILLERAEREFLDGDFQDALLNYSLILKDYPAIQEAKVGVYLCDLATQSSEEAIILFDYYQMIKEENENALEVISDLIESLDNTSMKLHELFSHTIEDEIEYSEAIRYRDFIELVKDKGSFKEIFENIMFSTRVVITQKEEFIDFVTKLCHEGFSEIALHYLDNTAVMFGNDQEILALYGLVTEKRL